MPGRRAPRALGRMALLGSLGLACLAAAPAPPGGAVPRKDAWIQIDTASFTLFSSAPEGRARAIARTLETFRLALSKLHPGSLAASPRITYVYVFRSAGEGLPYAGPRGAAAGHAGFALSPDAPNYISLAAPTDDTRLDVLYHALAHQFVDDNLPRLPAALEEGFAEFYSTFRADGQAASIGLFIDGHVRWLAAHPLLPLGELFSLDAGAVRAAPADRRATFHAESWALVHYLANGHPERRRQLPAFLDRMLRGAPLEAALREAFQVGPDVLLEEVRRYLAARRFPPASLPLEGAAAAGAPAVGRPMTRDEVLCRLGDLLGHVDPGGAAGAEAHFQEALRLNPAQALAHTGLGHLRDSQGRLPEAIPHLEKALEIDPKDVLASYLLGRGLLRLHPEGERRGTPEGSGTPAWLDRARVLLARTIVLRPSLAAAYVALASTHTYPDGDVASGIDLLEKARLMLPARMDLAGNQVYLHLRRGERARAQELVDRVLAPSGDARALKAARETLAAYDQHQAALKSLSAPKPPAMSKAEREAWRQRSLKMYQEALAEATDPEVRRRLHALIDGLLDPDPDAYRRQVEAYNKAVELANRRDFAAAIALLEGMLPQIKARELAEQTQALLDRLRKDAARLHPPAN
jgi:tetratricopeptide (TPR) repeat protein